MLAKQVPFSIWDVSLLQNPLLQYWHDDSHMDTNNLSNFTNVHIFIAFSIIFNPLAPARCGSNCKCILRTHVADQVHEYVMWNCTSDWCCNGSSKWCTVDPSKCAQFVFCYDRYHLTDWPLGDFDKILVNVSLVGLPPVECQWTLLMMSQHWFR